MVNRRKAKPGEARGRLLDIGIDVVCAKIVEGQGYRQIAAEAGVGVATMVEWIGADPDRSARARRARIAFAEISDELALEALQQLGRESSAGDIARAREIASHNRWRARTRDPRRFGEKFEIDTSVRSDGLAELIQYVAENGKPLPIAR